jgi:hypothetical protein
MLTRVGEGGNGLICRTEAGCNIWPLPYPGEPICEVEIVAQSLAHAQLSLLHERPPSRMIFRAPDLSASKWARARCCAIGPAKIVT